MMKQGIGIKRLLTVFVLVGMLTVSLSGCNTNGILTDITTAKIATNPYYNAFLSSDGALWVQQQFTEVTAMTAETAAKLGDNVREAYDNGIYDGQYYGLIRLCDGVLKFADSIYGICVLKTNGELYLYPGGDTSMTLIAKGVKDVFDQNGKAFYSLENGDLIALMSNASEGDAFFSDETGRNNLIVAKNCRDAGELFYVTEQGELFVKGVNSYGVFGNGTYDETPFEDYLLGLAKEPTGYDIRQYVKAFDGMKKVYGLTSNIYAIREDNTLWAWGNNELGLVGNGEQGDGLDETRDVVTAPVKILGNVKKLVSADARTDITKYTSAAGPDAVFALTYDGDVYAWGYNTYGLVGDGKQAAEGEELIVNAPKKILSEVADIVSNQYAVFALKNDGSVYGWGWSLGGETGTGKQNANGERWALKAEDFVAKPTKILSGVVLMCETPKATMAAIKKDGSLVMWGDNPFLLVLPDSVVATTAGKKAIAIQGVPTVNLFIKCEISADGEIIFGNE